jgi:hypothetical protein
METDRDIREIISRKEYKLPPLRCRSLLIIIVLLFLPVIPCYAYGDPTGGALFQVLLPALAVFWGMLLIFANKLRRGARILFRKIYRTSNDD